MNSPQPQQRQGAPPWAARSRNSSGASGPLRIVSLPIPPSRALSPCPGARAAGRRRSRPAPARRVFSGIPAGIGLSLSNGDGTGAAAPARFQSGCVPRWVLGWMWRRLAVSAGLPLAEEPQEVAGKGECPGVGHARADPWLGSGPAVPRPRAWERPPSLMSTN